MKTATVIAATFLMAALLLPSAALGDEVQDTVTKLMEGGAKSLVVVEFDLKRTDGQGGREMKLQGSVVGADGLVLVTGAKQVDPDAGSGNSKPAKFTVKFPGDVKVEARFVGKDDQLNLALLRLNPSDEERAPFPVAGFDPAAAIRPGQQLIALKRLPRSDDDLVTFTLLRVSTVIPRPGLPTEYRLLGSLSSFEGCPVYTLDARLAGYISGGDRPRGGRGRGGGFRIVNGRLERVSGGGGGRGNPTRILHSTVVREFLSDPTKFARRDCWLGVKDLQALTKPLAEAYGIEKPGGLIVGDVSENGPAERAGFKAGDVIVAMDGDPMETDKDRDIASFSQKIRRGKTGAVHEFGILRPGDEGFEAVAIKVTLEEAPLSENEIPEYDDKTFGLKLKPLTRDYLERSRLPLDTKGVRVTSVESASWAYLAGIRSGDIIQKMVLMPCPDLAAYKKIMAGLMKSRDSEVCYNVTRSRKSLFLCVRPDWTTVEKMEK